MAAEEQVDAIATAEQSSADLAANPGANQLAPAVRDWLAARIEHASRPTVLSVHALPGRYLLRVELGATASSIELQERGEVSAAELVNAVRRWARSRSLAHRVEPARNGEIRIAFTPVASHS